MRTIKLTEEYYKLIKRSINYMYESQCAWIDEEEHITNKEFVENMHKQHKDLKILKEFVESIEKEEV